MAGFDIDPAVAAQSVQEHELVRFKAELDSLKKQLAGGAGKEKQLKKACTDFESVFISKLWQEMKNTVPKEGYLHSRQGEMYASMFDQAFAEKMAENGGIGLADMLYKQLQAKLKNVSGENLPGGAEIKPLNPEPEPIALKRAQPMSLKPQPGAGKAASGQAVATALAEAAAVRPDNDAAQAQVESLARKIEAGQNRRIDWPSQSTGWRRATFFGRGGNRGG